MFLCIFNSYSMFTTLGVMSCCCYNLGQDWVVNRLAIQPRRGMYPYITPHPSTPPPLHRPGGLIFHRPLQIHLLRMRFLYSIRRTETLPNSVSPSFVSSCFHSTFAFFVWSCIRSDVEFPQRNIRLRIAPFEHGVEWP